MNCWITIFKWSQRCRGIFIPASNEPSDCLQAFMTIECFLLYGDCREDQIPRPLGRFKFDAPLLAAGFLT